jgi:radical SAM superfamily enzyme YgiQ (UPF0313 family)
MKSDFLFIYLERSFGGLCQGCRPYLGVGYVLAYGGYRSEQARIYYSDNGKTWEELAQDICLSAAKGVGFTVYESNYSFISKLATRIRTLRPDLLIVCGGPCATFSSKRMLEDNLAIDLCLLGEAELTFKQLMDEGFSHKIWAKLPGLAYREEGGYRATKYGEHYYLNRDSRDTLSGLPSPYLSGIVSPADAPELGIVTSRGCANLCTYCSFAAIGNRRVRFFPESHVLEELKLICRHFESSGESAKISFNDDNFTVRIDRAKRILDELRSIRPKNLSFSLMARPDDIHDTEFLELAHKAGIVEIGFGLESASPEVLSLVKKVGTCKHQDLKKEHQYVEAIRKAVTTTAGYGIEATVSIILGLPGDNLQRGAETIDFLKSLPLSLYYHNILKIYDGTELAQDHMRFGLKRLAVEDSPFPVTRHAYDTSALPILLNAMRSREYLSRSMAVILFGLTGLAASDVLQGYECLYLDIENQHEPLDWDSLPIGTFFIQMPGVKRNDIWRKKGFGSCEIIHTNNGHHVDPEVFMNGPFLPVVLLPGEKGLRGDIDRACLEFMEISLDSEIPGSDCNHWRLPYAACGLLPGKCPGRSRRLRSQSGNDGPCVYHKMEPGVELLSQCETCEQYSACPKCLYLLKQFGKAYCDYHRSDKPGSLRAYLLAHLHALRDRNARINALPSIRIEKFNIQLPNVRVLSINNKMTLIHL